MKKFLSLGVFLAGIWQAPASAITYTWAQSSIESSNYLCNASIFSSGADTCSVTFNNFKLEWNGSSWTPYSGSEIGSIVFQSTTGSSYTITNNNAKLATFGGAINSNSAFTISNSLATSPSDSYATFNFASPVSAGWVENDIVYINSIITPTNFTSDIFTASSTLDTWISGTSAPAPLGVLALVPFYGLINKRRIRTKFMLSFLSPKPE